MAEQEQKQKESDSPPGFGPISSDELNKAMNAVKDAFIKSAKERFNFEVKYFNPEYGISRTIPGGQTVIGLVSLVKPGLLGGYFANIRAFRVVGTAEPQPYEFQGYFVSSRPYLQFVYNGEHAFGINNNNKDSFKDFAKENKNANLSKPVKGVPIGFGVYLPFIDLGFVQGLVDKKEGEILEKVGLKCDDVSQFRVVSALNRNDFSFKIGDFKAKINIASRYGYTQTVDVQLTNVVLGDQQTITIGNAFLWG